MAGALYHGTCRQVGRDAVLAGCGRAGGVIAGSKRAEAACCAPRAADRSPIPGGAGAGNAAGQGNEGKACRKARRKAGRPESGGEIVSREGSEASGEESRQEGSQKSREESCQES